MKYNQIIKRLIEARKVAGLNQTQVAHMVGLSIASSFSDIETGKNPLSVERLLELCDIYGVSVEWVMTGVNPAFDPKAFIEAVGTLNKDTAKIMHLLDMTATR